MTPSIQLTILRALAEKPMTTRGVEKAVPYGSESVRGALNQASHMGRVEYHGTCTRGGTWTVTPEGLRFIDRIEKKNSKTKVCRTCKLRKPLSAFPEHRPGKPRPDCKVCRNGTRRSYYQSRRTREYQTPKPVSARVLELMPRPL